MIVAFILLIAGFGLLLGAAFGRWWAQRQIVQTAPEPPTEPVGSYPLVQVWGWLQVIDFAERAPGPDMRWRWNVWEEGGPSGVPLMVGNAPTEAEARAQAEDWITAQQKYYARQPFLPAPLRMETE